MMKISSKEYKHVEVSEKMGIPQELDGLCHGKSENKMDDLGVPHLRKPPYQQHAAIPPPAGFP